MKIVKLVMISFLGLLFLLVVAGVIFVSTFDVNRYKPQILTQAKAALNRDVDFAKAALSFSLSKGLSVRIYDAKIGEDPEVAKGNFLEAKDVSVGIDLLGLLFRRQLNVSYLYIDGPSIKVIRRKDGRINVTTLASPQSAPTPAVKASSPALPALLISSIKLTNGILSYEDRSFEPAVNLAVSDLTLQIAQLSLEEPFPFTAEGAVLAAKKNIRVEGRIQLDIQNNAVTVSGLKTGIDLESLQLEKIPVSFPMAKDASLPVEMKGKVTVTADTLSAGAKGITNLSGEAAVSGGLLKFREIASPVKEIELHSALTLPKITVDSFSAAVAGGKIKGTGNIENYLTTQNYDLSLTAENIKIQELVSQEKSSVKAEGVLAGDLKVKGAGFSPEAVKSTLAGDGNLWGTSLVIKDINLLRLVLDKISLIPDLSRKVEAGLPDKYKQKLAQKDTTLSDVKMPLALNHGRVVFKDVKINADEFIFAGQAETGLDGSFSSQGSFLIPQELSAAMMGGVPELQYLLNQDKEIYIPLKVSGKAPGVNVAVDLEYLGKKLLINQIQNKLLDIFNKAVGPVKSEPSEPGGQ